MTFTHGESGYGNNHCRCDVCTSDHARAVALRRAERYAYTAAWGLPPEVEHGNSAYTNWGCRCDVCRGAQNCARAANGRAQRARARALLAT